MSQEGKHTPGPWAFRIGDICGPDDKDGDDTVIAAIGRSSGLRSAQYSIVKSGPEYEANARLIAAAPDLLECVKIALESTGYAHERKLFRDAIAKATGAA